MYVAHDNLGLIESHEYYNLTTQFSIFHSNCNNILLNCICKKDSLDVLYCTYFFHYASRYLISFLYHSPLLMSVFYSLVTQL